MPFIRGGRVCIKIGTTQYQQYDFLGWSNEIGRNFFYFRGIEWGGDYDIWSYFKSVKDVLKSMET